MQPQFIKKLNLKIQHACLYYIQYIHVCLVYYMLLKKSSNKVYFDYNKRLGHFESDRRFVSVR